MTSSLGVTQGMIDLWTVFLPPARAGGLQAPMQWAWGPETLPSSPAPGGALLLARVCTARSQAPALWRQSLAR